MNKTNFNREIESEKIQVISEIDQLKVVANNHYLMKKYYEAIKVSELILELAKKANLASIIEEQEDFIFKVRKLIDEGKLGFIREEFEELRYKYKKLVGIEDFEDAHVLIENFKHKFEKVIELGEIHQIEDFLDRDRLLWQNYQNKQVILKKQLDPLEIQFNSYVKTNNLKLAQDTLNKAEDLLKQVDSSASIIRETWQAYKEQLNEHIHEKDIEKKVSTSLDKISLFTDSYQFQEGRELIKDLDEIIDKIRSPQYIKDFEIKKKTLIDAEEKYNKLFNDMENLELSIRTSISDGLFSKAMNECEQIIKISRFIGQQRYVDMYSELLNQIKVKIQKFRQLKETTTIINSLAKEAVQALKNENFNKSLVYFKEMRKLLIEYSRK
jgi:hypothetical protein